MKSILKIFLIACIGLLSSCQEEEITIFLAGDSTMAHKIPAKRPMHGWGEKFQVNFNDKVTIDNHAVNGKSTNSFIRAKLWQNILDSLQQDDYVFIQFGHNDEPKGRKIGFTTLEQYEENLAQAVNDVRAKGATPILLTPIMRRRFDKAGEFYDTHGAYPDALRKVASEHQVTLLDMHQQTEKLIREMGEEKSKELFLILEAGESSNYTDGVDDNTHLSEFGAEKIATLVVNEMKKQNIELCSYLK